ncbi:MAG: S8 family serine peptidase, partial [Flavobacteriales bacterium]
MKKTALSLFLLLTSMYAYSQQPAVSFLIRSFVEKNKNNTEPAHFFVDAEKNQLETFLRLHNGFIKYSFGKYAAISLPANELENLAAQSFVKHIELSAQHPVTLNDTMRVRNRINQIQLGQAPLPQGFTGTGVIIGFIDTGIDFNHEDFKDSSGNTRVLRIWDQTQPVNGFTPPAYGYGQVYDSAYIMSGSCPSTDPSGHGSTVVGTACGNGLSTGTHWGAAPEAKIIMVKTNESAPNWSATVADAVDYIYKVADSLGMPCVINASVGDYYGSHDGLDLPAQFMDSLVKAKRGRLFVCAGGNSGELPNYHLGYTVTNDTAFTWMKYHPLNGMSAFPYGVVFFESWSDSIDAANMRFSIGADKVSPYYKFRGETNWHGITDMLNTVLTDTIFSVNNDILGIVDYYSEFSFGRYLLQVHMEEPDSNAYYFRFSTTGSGRFDIWSDEWLGISNMVNAGLPTVPQYPDMIHYQTSDSSKIIVSGFNCLESVITVANYNNLQQYNSLMGPVNLGGIENAIAPSSSRGPTRDNRIKPEVGATGNVTFSPGPASLCSLYVASFPDRILPDSVHMRNGGTSMASPVVAGIAALMLERCPTLSWDEFRDAIINSVYTDGFPGAVPNMSFGYGKVDGFAAMQQTLYTAS